MELPKEFTIKVEDLKGKGIPGIIVEFEVVAGTKNIYKILSPKTNQEGETYVTKEDFIGQFKDHFEIGLMDYNGSIESADAIINVSLFDPKWSIENKGLCLAWPLLKNEIDLWDSREDKYKYLISCNNLKYKGKTQKLDIRQSSHVGIQLCKSWF